MNNTTTTVHIKTVPRESVQGRHNYINVLGNKVFRTKAKTSVNTLCFTVDNRTNRLATGFDELVDNPFFKQTLAPEWQDLASHDKIKLQHVFEIRFNKPRGFYDSAAKPTLSGNPNDQTYLQSFRYTFVDGTTVLDLNKERDAIAYQLCLHSNLVANKKEDINPTSNLLYISQINEGEAEKAKRRDIIEKGTATLYNFKKKQSEENIYKLCIVLELFKSKELSIDAMKDQLSSFIGEGAVKRLSNIGKLEHYIEMMEKDKVKFTNTYLLQELLNKRIVSDYQSKFIWENAPDSSIKLLGKTRESVIEFLNNVENKDWRDKLIKELQILVPNLSI